MRNVLRSYLPLFLRYIRLAHGACENNHLEGTHEMIITSTSDLNLLVASTEKRFKISGVSTNDIFHYAKEGNGVSIKGVILAVKKNEVAFFKPSAFGKKSFTVRQLVGQRALSTINESLSDSFKDRMSYLEEIERKNYIDVLSKSSEVGNVLAVFENEKMASLLIFRDYELDGEVTSLISWFWVAPGLGAKRTYAVFSILTPEMLANAKETIIAYAHTLNSRSLLITRKFNMEPVWIQLE